MDVCFIILAHKHPGQVVRLVERLTGPNHFFYIHIDKSADAEPFKAQLLEQHNICFLKERERGTWGDIGIVKATLNALEEVLKDGRNGYCILLSGQDYPLREAAEITKTLQANAGVSFTDTWALPAQRWYNGGIDRIQYYKYNLQDGKRNYTLIPSLFSKAFYQNTKSHLRQIIRLLRQKKLPFQLLKSRNFPAYLKPYGGSQWWAITTQTASQITVFLKQHKSYLDYHKFTLLPDEIFFQTLIMHFAVLEGKPVKPSLTYLRWEGRESAHPVTFSLPQLVELKEVAAMYPEKLFARKFNPDDPVLYHLDRL